MTAVLTSDVPDLVSHVAVRARNAHVLFATCFDPAVYAHLKTLQDKSLALQVSPGGDVTFEEVSASHAEGHRANTLHRSRD